MSLLLILTGCPTPLPPQTNPNTPVDNSPPAYNTDPLTDLNEIPDSIKQGGNPAISPALVTISGYYAGGRVEYELTIYNGTSESMDFAISSRVPDNTRTGYVKATSDISSWVTINNPLVSVDSMSLTTILIVLQMPLDANAPGQQWEFWVSIIPQGQKGMVTTEMASRWLINMKA